MADHYKSVRPPHYELIWQPNPIFPLQIQSASIAPYITGYCCWLPDFETQKFFLKDYCQHIIGKLQFQFPTHVLEGGGIHELQNVNEACCYQLLIFLPYSSNHVGQEKQNKKKIISATIQESPFIILLNN